MDSCFRMIRSNFLSREDRCELLSCVKRQREDHGVARRANALLLLDDGKSCVEIAQVLYFPQTGLKPPASSRSALA